MSYILDALKRAEAERAKGSVPGLHAQPLPLPDDSSGRAGLGARWPWFLGAVLLVGSGTLTWRLLQPAEPLATPVPPQAVAPQADVPKQAPIAPVDAVGPVRKRMLSETLRPPAAPMPKSAAVASSPVLSSTNRPEKDVAEAVRPALPVLNISGAMYAKEPKQRMLVLNGQVVREGEEPQPDLVLEEIQAKSAVFSYRGQRYSVSY